MELSIDTSTRYAAVGLSRQGETLAEMAWRSERNHSVELVPAIRELMDRPGIQMKQVEAIFVAAGPGAFSALRVGISTAKALAVGLDVPLVSVGTLEIEAQPYLGMGTPVCALIEGGRKKLYVARYPASPENPTPEYDVLSHEDLISTVDSVTLLCGEGVRAVADMLRERSGGDARMANVHPPTRKASVLAQLGHRRREAGGHGDPEAVHPIYLRSAQVDNAQSTRARI